MARARQEQIVYRIPLITTASLAVFGGRFCVVRMSFQVSHLSIGGSGLWSV